MAIQRLGSSLIAKSQVGSRLRSTEEERQTGALQRGSASAQTGSPVRGSVDEPIEKLNPQGTQKIVSVQPSITPTEKSVVSKIGIAPSIGAASRVNNPSGTSNGGGTGTASSPGGGASPASRTAFRAAQVGASASGIGRPALGYTPGGGGASGAVKGASTQGSVSRVTNPSSAGNKSFLQGVPSAIGSFGGGRVSAGELPGKKAAPKEGRNLSQGIALTIGNLTGNKNLQSYGKSAAVTNSGVGSITKPSATAKAVVQKATPVVQKAATTLRSAVSNTAQKASNTVQNVIRSLTKKK